MAEDDFKKEQHLPPKDFTDEAYAEGLEPTTTQSHVNKSDSMTDLSSTSRPENSATSSTSGGPKPPARGSDAPFKHIPLSESQSQEVLSQPAEDILSEDFAPRSAWSSEPLASSAPQNDITPEQLRAYLLEKARHFLHSPEIRWQEIEKKKEFLLAKGLDRTDIKMLLDEVAPPPPPLPPRNYPGAKESRRMYLLKWFAKFTKVCAYIAGTSAAAMFVYWWLLLPRISSSLAARAELQNRRLKQAEKLKEQVDEVAHSREVNAGSDEITVVDDAAESTGEPRSNHPTDESFKDLTRALSDLRTSLTTLRFARQVDKSRQETLDSVNNLTGYVSARVYSVPGYTAAGGGAGVKRQPVLGPIEDEVKSEIRALKGLVLNRRSFVAAAMRNNSQPSVPAAAA